MRTVAWIGVIYLGVVGAFTFWSASASGTTPTADSIAMLPSIGTLFSASGGGATVTAAALDLAGAGAIYFFYLK